MEELKEKFPSELRFDLVSMDWVVIATGRGKRPETFKKEKNRQEAIPESQCPFHDIKNQQTPVLFFANGKKVDFKPGDKFPENWTTVVFPNKYPAFSQGKSLNKRTEGNLYQKMDAVGFHEVVVTKDHNKQLAEFSDQEFKEVIDVYQERYLELKNKKFVNHISIFHNHGWEAGASVSHPHSQIITTPLVDADLNNSLCNAKGFNDTNKECIYCRMSKWEMKAKKRIVFENKEFLVICPFASKTAFEMIVTPKKHLSNFEKITEEEKTYLVEAFLNALRALYGGLGDPAFNFYLHTAPCDDKTDYGYYHWHFTILPHTAIPAGFEVGTKMEISTIEPEKAAEYLKNHIADIIK